MKALRQARWLIAWSWLLAGCLRGYVTPEATQPTADLILSRGPGAQSNTFLAYRDDSCSPDGTDTGLLGVVGSFWDNTKTVRVRTGTRMFIKAGAYASTMQFRAMKQEYCVNVVSFVPQPGKRYQLRQDQSADGCCTLVTESDTAQPPPDLVHHVIKEPCKIRR